MRKLWIAPLAALVVAFAPLAQAQMKTDKDDKSAASGFVQQALKSGEEEVALAKMAAEKSQNNDVKQFAQMLVSDHTALNEQLALLAKRNGATPPKSGTDSSPPPTAPGAGPASPKARQLATLSGSEFDKKFLEMIVEGHEKSVETYTKASESEPNPAAKKLANEALPKIKEHLAQAKSLQSLSKDKKN